jgi:hypothetical protein
MTQPLRYTRSMNSRTMLLSWKIIVNFFDTSEIQLKTGLQHVTRARGHIIPVESYVVVHPPQNYCRPPWELGSGKLHPFKTAWHQRNERCTQQKRVLEPRNYPKALPPNIQQVLPFYTNEDYVLRLSYRIFVS